MKMWENHGKTMGKPRENGDLYGKIQHFSWIPSGKQPHNYGKSLCLMGKSTN
jgi:hypothetical protein